MESSKIGTSIQNISIEVSLKNCPFCGENGEVHTRQGSSTIYAELKDVPIGAIIYGKTGNGCIKVRQMVFVPRCANTKCVARNTKAFETIEDATNAWNDREENPAPKQLIEETKSNGKYRKCGFCGANLDHGEICDCQK